MKTICVFCGSRPGARAEYVASASAFGTELARRGLALVYGGASVGVMGALADAALAAGAFVTGVMPQRLVDREIAHLGLSEMRIVTSMHERKATMEKLADGFVALPGGFGTFEELFEIITWAQLGMHSKPIGVLNVAGYYDPLIHVMRKGVVEGFIPAEQADRILFDEEPVSLIDRMLRHHPSPMGPKFIDRKQT